MRVVMTSTLVPISDEDLRIFDGLDVQVDIIDGSDRQTLLDGTRDADALLVLAEQIDKEVIDNLAHCRSISRFGIGVDMIDLDAARERGIIVTNVPDANFKEVAVHAMGMILALTRRILSFDSSMKNGRWAPIQIGAGLRRPESQTLGLLGMGRIGTRVASMAREVGFSVIAHDPWAPSATMKDLGIRPVSFEDLLAESDILSVHIPLTAETSGMIDDSVISRMRRGSIFINVSRGALVDEPALIKNLQSGQLGGAGLDAYAQEPLSPDSPLRQLDSVILSPHSAALSTEAMDESRIKMLEECARILRGDQPRYPVD